MRMRVSRTRKKVIKLRTLRLREMATILLSIKVIIID